MNLYICGQKHFGMSVYLLAKEMGYTIVGVSSPAFRDEKLKQAFAWGDEQQDRLRQVAGRDNVPWLEAGQLREDTLPSGVDLIVAAHSHDFIGRKTRNRAKLGAIGYHPSLLPLHRGRDAVRWAVKLRERVTGGTVFWLNDTVDGGPIAAQEPVLIDPAWDAAELWREALQPLGIRLLRRVFTQVEHNVLVRIPQNHKLATWEPALDPPALYRPDLPQLGDAWSGYKVIVDANELS